MIEKTNVSNCECGNNEQVEIHIVIIEHLFISLFIKLARQREREREERKKIRRQID